MIAEKIPVCIVVATMAVAMYVAMQMVHISPNGGIINVVRQTVQLYSLLSLKDLLGLFARHYILDKP
jgi:hypothetical protein